MLLVQNIVTTAVSTMGGSIERLQWIYPPGHKPRAARSADYYEETRDVKPLVNNPVFAVAAVGGVIALVAILATAR